MISPTDSISLMSVISKVSTSHDINPSFEHNKRVSDMDETSVIDGVLKRDTSEFILYQVNMNSYAFRTLLLVGISTI